MDAVGLADYHDCVNLLCVSHTGVPLLAAARNGEVHSLDMFQHLYNCVN